jgi:hypothetical protein
MDHVYLPVPAIKRFQIYKFVCCIHHREVIESKTCQSERVRAYNKREMSQDVG